MTFLHILISLCISSSNLDIEGIYLELSMDTYKWGSDVTPLVKTVNGKSHKIDSLANSKFYGRVGNRRLIWDSTGACISRKCRKGDELTWSELWTDVD